MSLHTERQNRKLSNKSFPKSFGKSASLRLIAENAL